MRLFGRFFVGFSLFALAGAAQAQMDTKTAAAIFGARESILDASLSPDGTKVALVKPGPEQSTIVAILDLTTGSAKAVNSANGKPLTLRGCGWASNSRLVCSLFGIMNSQGAYEGYSRLIAVNAADGDVVPLGITQRIQAYISHSDGYVIDWRDGKTGEVLIARNYIPLKDNAITVGSKAEGLAVDLVDTKTGKGKHIESADPYVGSYIADGQGNIRIKAAYDWARFGTVDRGITNYYYRTADSDKWKPFSDYSWSARTGLRPVAVDGTKNVAYVIETTDGRDQLFRVALDGTMRKELAYADPRVDVDGVVTVGRSGHVVGATYATDTRHVAYFDPAYEELHSKLARALSTLPLINIVDSSADETRHLIFAASDTDPGRYFLYDSAKKSLTPLGQMRPDISTAPLGAVKSITYAAADGTQIPGYLTLPPGRGDKPGPAIVMPHGGPASRDEWGFDWLAQFFVSQGYAVLQPNYRGSSGYGQNWFIDNGFRSWRTAISDVDDAARWMVAQKIADPDQLAIVGWSYGGYAALQSGVVAPSLFKAIVAIAPVTDLGMLRSEQSAYDRASRDYIGEGAQLEEGSPLRHVDAIKAPVLMFHGTKDINVDAAESKAMDKALQRAGKSSELVLYPDIDHQLRDSSVRTDMLTRAANFLNKTLKR
jgi:dipeptidyl aminopeptidase/acylaminoacyl peptidase